MGSRVKLRHRSTGFGVLAEPTLKNIALNGSAQQQAAAIDTMMLDQQFGQHRAFDPRSVRIPGVPPTPKKKSLVALDPAGVPRQIFDARNEEYEDFRNRWQIVCSDPAPPAHPVGCSDVDLAYSHLGDAIEFYVNVLNPNAKKTGVPLTRAAVHVGKKYLNARWTKGMLYFGDGDGELFEPFGRSLDIVAHEWFHGVTANMLTYHGETGAIDESMADIFASLVMQFRAKETVTAASWLIGASALTSKFSGQALRSLKAPGTAFSNSSMGTDPQPSHYDQVVETDEDDGGVHINSGVANHAFYLAATNLAAANYGNYAWDTAGRIWYAAVAKKPVNQGMNFATFGRRTAASALKIFDADAQKIVQEAWRSVGVVFKI